MSTVSTSASADLHTAFQALRAEIAAQLDEPGVVAGDVARGVADLKALYAVGLAEGSLPSYDQRRYELSLREVEGRLAGLRAREKPRAKFSFARPSSASTPPPLPSSPSSLPSVSAPHPAASPAPDPVAPAEQADPRVHPVQTPPHVASQTYDTGAACALSDLHGQHITPARLPAQRGEYTLSLENLSDSVIDLRPAPTPPASSPLDPSPPPPPALGSLHARGLRRCVLITAPMNGSALLHDLTDCLVVLASHQFRMHTSSRCAVRLHVSSVPVIEHCADLVFGPYPGCIGVSTDGPNYVDRVADFDWVRPGPSPHWRLQTEREGADTDARLSALRHESDVRAVQDVRALLDSLLGATQNNV